MTGITASNTDINYYVTVPVTSYDTLELEMFVQQVGLLYATKKEFGDCEECASCLNALACMSKAGQTIFRKDKYSKISLPCIGNVSPATSEEVMEELNELIRAAQAMVPTPNTGAEQAGITYTMNSTTITLTPRNTDNNNDTFIYSTTGRNSY
jgi:hypothetical protein